MTEPTEADERPRVIVEFTEAETREVHRIAEWYATTCIKYGAEVPPDPMRALLYAALSLHDYAARLDNIIEAAGIDKADYLEPRGPLQ